MMIEVLVCIDNEGYEDVLKMGKMYISCHRRIVNDNVAVVLDFGVFDRARFVNKSELRAMKIKNLMGGI